MHVWVLARKAGIMFVEHEKHCVCICLLKSGGMQEIVTEFMVETMSKAMAASALKGGKPSTEDMMFLVRKVLLTVSHRDATGFRAVV